MDWSESPTTQMLPCLGGQQLDQHVLGMIGVLVLIDEYVSEPVLPPFEHLGECLKQLDGELEDVIEVDGGCLHEALLVEPIDVRHALVVEAGVP